jgi:hypothetical protein
MQNNFSENYLQFGQAFHTHTSNPHPTPQPPKKTSQIISLLGAQASPVSGLMLVLIYQAADNHIPKVSITTVLAVLCIEQS